MAMENLSIAQHRDTLWYAHTRGGSYKPKVRQFDVCRNLSFGLATKAKGVARLQAKRKEVRKSRQRHYKSAGQEEARELRQKEARESHHILPGMLESVRECEGVNTHTPKATPTLGDGVPVDSRNFRKRLQGSNLNGLWRSLYHWKALGA